MANQIEYLKILNETRATVWAEANRLLDDVAKEKRELSAEENAQWLRYNARLDEIGTQIDEITRASDREHVAATGREALERQVGTTAAARMEKTDRQVFANYLRTAKHADGGYEIDVIRASQEVDMIRSGASAQEVAEYRALAWDTGSIASGVPTTMARELYQLMTAPIAMFNLPTTKVFTGSGEQMKFPRVNAHGIATQVSGQGTTLAGTDPTFLSMTLDAYKYAELVKVASEVLTDTVFDVAGFVGGNIARAVGQLIDTHLVSGTGSGQPQGITTAVLVGSNGTIATGGSLIGATYENLVDLVYSINGNYRASGNAAFLMRDLSAAAVRKLRDGAGGTLGAAMWEPSLVQGIQGSEPGLLLGYPVFTDPNVSSMASNAKTMVFGDWSAYYIRQVGNLIVERDDSVYFATDEVGFRGKWRVDGDCIDLTALNRLRQAVGDA